MSTCLPTTCQPTQIIESKSTGRTRDLPRHVLAAPEVTGYPLYPCNNDDQTGFYLLKPVDTYNLVTNPTFYNNLDGWEPFNSIIARTNEWSFDQGYSLFIKGSGDYETAERREYAEIEIFQFTCGSLYSASAYLWLPALFDPNDPAVGTISIAQSTDDGVTIANEVFSTKVDKAKVWERLGLTTRILPDATNIYLRVNLRSQDAQEINFPNNPTGLFNQMQECLYADMLQFEQGEKVTTPFHGDYNTCATNTDDCNGYTWLGVPHNSISHRSDCTRDGGELICLSDLGFEILSHTGHGAPPVRDISFPYVNRAGEFYQKTAVDSRIITLNGYLCDITLKQLECKLYELGNLIWPNVGQCKGKFLLVYRHGRCDIDGCNNERDLAICVTYIGGLEGNRTNLYQQRISLQFKAHDPDWFEWPGHIAQSIDASQTSIANKVFRIARTGELTGTPIGIGRTINTITCMLGDNKIFIGGEFETLNDVDTTANYAIYDCDGVIDIDVSFDGPIYDSERDSAGNVLIGGDFSLPFNNISILYADTNTFGSFPAYTGGIAYAISAPFWGEIVVGTEDSIHILVNGTWLVYQTNGRVNDIRIDAFGNIIAVGEFTTIDGVSFPYAARFNVNTDGCLDIVNAEWESVGAIFDAPMNTVDIDLETNAIYIGGESLNSSVQSVDTCTVTSSNVTDSSNSGQILSFVLFAGNQYDIEFSFQSDEARQRLIECLNAGSYSRIQATNPNGGSYNILIGPENFISANQSNTASHKVATIRIDVNTTIGEPCATQNVAFVNEFQTSQNNIVSWSTYDLSNPTAGLGVDNTINDYSIECFDLTTSFTGDNIPINHVACIIGENVTSLGDGIDFVPNDIFVHPLTKRIYAAYNGGLLIWNGFDWCEFDGIIGNGNANVLKVDFCITDCSIVVLHDQDLPTTASGYALAEYNGSFEQYQAELHIKGPISLKHFSNNAEGKSIKFCTEIVGGENAVFRFGTGNYASNFRNRLGQSVLPSSQTNITLNKCINPVTAYGENDTCCTDVMLLWRRSHWGIDALCCEPNEQPKGEFCPDILHRTCPTDECCNDTGFTGGELWACYDGNCIELYINTMTECGDNFEGCK